MKTTQKAFLGAVIGAVLTCASVAYASTWVYVGTMNSDNHLKCDQPDSIDTSTWKVNGDVVTAWSKLVRGPSYAACGGMYHMMYTQSEYDCSDRTVHMIYAIDQNWAGVRSSEDLSSSSTIPVGPDTMGEIELDYVCHALWVNRP